MRLDNRILLFDPLSPPFFKGGLGGVKPGSKVSERVSYLLIQAYPNPRLTREFLPLLITPVGVSYPLIQPHPNPPLTKGRE
jgi:hypothetical protein